MLEKFKEVALMLTVAPQHEGRPTNAPTSSLPQKFPKTFTPEQPSPQELMERDGRRTPSPDGTS